ncbi:MAG: FecR domain-containing protein [Fibrobacterota bacterium]
MKNAAVFILISVFICSAASLSFINGSVSINGRRARLGKEVGPKDTVSTGSESAADILLYDGTSVSLKENSKLVITEVVPEEKKADLTVLAGKVLSIAAKKSDFNLHTPTAVAAIRGTIFFCSVKEEKDYFCTCNGTVEYTNKKGKLKTVSTAHHKGVFVSKDGRFSDAGMDEHTDAEIFEQMYRLGK